MKIISMTASFGTLRNARLELGEGLNLIQAPNEGGKSTWCAFLRSMLYGIPTRERDRQGYIAEKNRYQPWDGGAMEGEVILTHRGRSITLRRGPKGSVPFGSFSAVYTGTNEPVPGLTAESCGEALLGVSREVYERSAFVGQGGAAISSSAELEKRIAALVSSGEEDVSFTQVEGRLKEWQRRRKFNKSGLIPKLENELTELGDALARRERAVGQAQDARREIETLAQREGALTAALEACRRVENRERWEKYRAAQAALEAAQDQVAAAEAAQARLPDGETLRRAQGELAYYNTLEANRRMAEGQIPAASAVAERLAREAQDPLFPDMSPDEAWQQASRDRDRVAAKQGRSPAVVATFALFGAAVLWFVYLIVRVALGQEILPWMYWIVVGAAVLVFAANMVNVNKIRAWRTEAEELLERYGAQYPDDILTRANDYREKHTAAQEAARRLEAVENAAADLARQKEALLAGLLETVHAFEPNVTGVDGVSAAISRGLSLREKLTAARVRLEGARALCDSLPKPEGEEASSAAPRNDGGGEAGVSPGELAARRAAVAGELARRRNDLALATGELGALGDGLALAARQEEAREELSRRREEYEALTTALEALDGANATLRSRFSPALNERAGTLLSALTGGRYRGVGLNRQFEAEAHEHGATLPRSTAALSQGTAEQVYLAARLAVCQLALPTEDPAPLVLDDALDAFDDTRMALALDCLLALGEERQILLFSCHGREWGYLEGKGCNRVALGV